MNDDERISKLSEENFDLKYKITNLDIRVTVLCELVPIIESLNTRIFILYLISAFFVLCFALSYVI